MKFKEFLKEESEKDLDFLLARFELKVDGKRIMFPHDMETWLNHGTNELRSDIKKISINARQRNSELVWPFSKDVSPDLIVSMSSEMTGNNILVNSFESFPHVNSLHLSNATIKSFDGIDTNPNLKQLWLNNVYVWCGMLRLLKCKHLNMFWLGSTHDENLKKAHKIIEAHLQDKDIVECQTALMDAGLEDFAKL